MKINKIVFILFAFLFLGINQNIVEAEENDNGITTFGLPFDAKAEGIIDEGLDTSTKVNIPDQNLKKAIYDSLSKDYSEDITKLEMESIEHLYLDSKQIVDLTGLEACENLKSIDLDNNAIKNISPICNLANLETVSINNNQIINFQELEKLPKANDVTIGTQHINSNRYVKTSDGKINIKDLETKYGISEKPTQISDNGIYENGNIQWNLKDFNGLNVWFLYSGNLSFNNINPNYSIYIDVMVKKDGNPPVTDDSSDKDNNSFDDNKNKDDNKIDKIDNGKSPTNNKETNTNNKKHDIIDISKDKDINIKLDEISEKTELKLLGNKKVNFLKMYKQSVLINKIVKNTINKSFNVQLDDEYNKSIEIISSLKKGLYEKNPINNLPIEYVYTGIIDSYNYYLLLFIISIITILIRQFKQHVY